MSVTGHTRTASPSTGPWEVQEMLDSRANALLISAAPDLLAGAKAILAARSGQQSIDAIIQLRNAIAKAEGRDISSDETITGEKR